MSLTWNNLRTHKLFAFFLYFTIMILGPEFLLPSWKNMPVFEGLIKYHQDVLSSASVLNLLDEDTILGILLMNREHRKKYSAVLFGTNLLSSFHLPGVKDQRVPDRKSVTELGVELLFQNSNPVFSNKLVQLCFSRSDFWALHLTVALKTVWNDTSV